MTDTTTPTRSDVLRALADRVERGESGREIEYEIARAVFPNIGEARIFVVDDDEPIFFSEPYRKQPAPHYTTSLDATEALRQAVLPGWWIEVKVTPDVWDLRNTSAFAWASISSPGCWARGTDVQAGPAYRLSGQCDARLPNAECRVRLAALLRALAAQETGNAG